MHTTQFLDLPIAQLPFEQAVDLVFTRAHRNIFSYVVTPNVDHIVRLDRAQNDPICAAFAAAYAAAELVFCDSRILTGLARLSGLRLPVVTGSDLTQAVLTDPRIAGCRIAIVGGQPALLAALQQRVSLAHFVQTCPPMNVLCNEAALVDIERFVSTAQADIVFFAIGAPQSEIVAHRCLQAGQARGIGLCIGASLQFIVGEKRRAPRWMQRLSAEWLFRLLTEPRRLWRRYLVEGPRVFAIWMRRGRR